MATYRIGIFRVVAQTILYVWNINAAALPLQKKLETYIAEFWL